MSGTNHDEMVNDFVSMTNCSNEEARRYLEIANWDPQLAAEIFFDSASGGSALGSNERQTDRHLETRETDIPAEHDVFDSDDETPIQVAIHKSVQESASNPQGSGTTSKKDQTNTSATNSKFATIGGLSKDESSSDEEGQAFYAGGSERSGQQIIGPKKSRNPDKNITSVFEAARKQGATELGDNDDENSSSANRRKERAFTGVGYTLGDETTPSRSLGQPTATNAAAANLNRPERIPLRFFSNGFTVGDSELRTFEDNKEFMEYIKRGEVPPELRNLSASGRQIEVQLEDHRGEEYKPTAPAFKAFGGVGHMLGSPAPNVVSSPTTTTSNNPSLKSSTPTDGERLERLAEQKLKSSTSSTMIRLRLPDLSTPVRIAIDLDRSINDLRRFLAENIPSLATSQFEFIEPPSIKIKREDETKTILNAKLNNATLVVRRI